MNFSAICRTCLKNNSLYPIFASEDNHERFSSVIYVCAGVQVRVNDGLPQKMCTACMKQLNNALKFRKQCKEVETELLKIKIQTESSKTISISTNEKLTMKITKNIPNESTTMKLLTIKKSNIQNCSSVTNIKTELHSINVKTEPTERDIDEDVPLKFFINKNNNSKIKSTENIQLMEEIDKTDMTNIKTELHSINVKTEPTERDIDEDVPLKFFINKNNNSKIKSTENIQLMEEIDKTDYSSDESCSYKGEEVLETEKTFQRNTDLPCEDATGTDQFTVFSQSPQKKNRKKILTMENIDKSKLNNIDNLENADSYTDSSSREDNKKHVQVPYNIVPNTARVVCKLCQKDLSIRSIDSHMARRHPGADERKVKCELCDKYVLKEKLNRHRIMMHGNIGVKCGYCKSEFKSKELLVDHVSTCTAKKRKRNINESGRTLAECDICKKTMQRASLKMHKAVKHSGLRPVCEHCGKSFGNKFRLNEHYRAKHGYEKFKCSYCDFRSAGIMALRNHERRHRGEKPFVCESCGAKFHAAYLLTQHKHSHRTEKLVKCDLCPASFKANNSLHMHKLTCHSKSLYRCTLCSRSYKCRYYAVKHARLAHNISGTPPVIKLMSQ